MDNRFHWDAAIKAGIGMGLSFCAYSLLMWITGLDGPYLHIGQYLDIAIILLPIAIILIAIRNQVRQQPFSIWRRLLFAILIGLVSFTIYDPFLYMYHNYINPEWTTWVVNLKRDSLAASGASADVIATEITNLNQAHASQNVLFKPQALIASVVVIPTLIALISLAFFRRSKAVVRA